MIDKSALKIQKMFDSISGSYDLANHVMTLGMISFWRKKLLQHAQPKPDARILDCATGTGDSAFAFAKHLDKKGEVFGIDFSPKMIELAKQKKQKIKTKCSISFQIGDMTSLPFEDNYFDITSVSYGLRNVSNL